MNDKHGYRFGPIDITEAIRIALAAAGHGEAYEVTPERDNGRAVWRVCIRKDRWSGVVCKIDMIDAVIKVQHTTSVPNIVFEGLPSVPIDQALKLGSDTLPGQIEEIRLEIDKGVTVWQIYSDDTTVLEALQLDAQTGETVEHTYS